MYTGIVQGRYQLLGLERQPGIQSMVLQLDAARVKGLEIGASVGVDGVCLTVTRIDGERAHFDVIQQTLEQTTLGELSVGDWVNVERSARYGDEIGGHGISGHVDTAVEIIDVATPENNRELTFTLPSALQAYIFQRGFVGLNGCSLTVAEVDPANTSFKVCLIPETLRITTFAEKVVGDRVNLELDRQTQAIVDTVQNYLRQHGEQLGTED